MRIFFSCVFFLSFLCCYAQRHADVHDLLEWNEFYTLSWEDFMGQPDTESAGDAATAIHITASPYYVKHWIRYDVHAYFIRSKSWTKYRSESLLRHEQLHFDIAELYARKIRKRIQELREQGVNDLAVFNSAIKELLNESNEVDQQYDLTTLHGALSRKQQLWEERIHLQLSGLKDFKKKKKVIAVREYRNPSMAPLFLASIQK